MNVTIRTATIGVTLAALTSGCGLNLAERPLPGAAGTGKGAYEVTLKLTDAGNLVPNAEVKVDDMTVGSVKKIDLDGWTATVVVGLDESVVLPADAEARIGQKSLLGSEYVEISAPRKTDASGPRLSDGDVIPVARTGSYTGTEDLLSALSVWLNGGGLQHVQTISTELNTALQGNEGSVRSLIANLNEIIGGLDEQKSQLIATIGSVDKLAGRLARQRDTLGAALEDLPTGLATVNRQRRNLTNALDALDELSTAGIRVIRSSGTNLTQVMNDLRPALREINAAADTLPDVLDIAGTVLFPVQAVPYVIKGDFLNAAVTADLTTTSIARGFFPETGVEDALDLIRTALQATDPLTGPLTDGFNDTTDDMHVGADDVTTDGNETDKPATEPEPTDAPSTPNLLQLLLGGL